MVFRLSVVCLLVGLTGCTSDSKQPGDHREFYDRVARAASQGVTPADTWRQARVPFVEDGIDYEYLNLKKEYVNRIASRDGVNIDTDQYTVTASDEGVLFCRPADCTLISLTGDGSTLVVDGDRIENATVEVVEPLVTPYGWDSPWDSAAYCIDGRPVVWVTLVTDVLPGTISFDGQEAQFGGFRNEIGEGSYDFLTVISPLLSDDGETEIRAQFTPEADLEDGTAIIDVNCEQ